MSNKVLITLRERKLRGENGKTGKVVNHPFLFRLGGSLRRLRAGKTRAKEEHYLQMKKENMNDVTHWH